MKDHNDVMYYTKMLFDKEIANYIDKSFRAKEDTLINHYGITKDDYVDNDDSYYLPFMEKFREEQKNNIINQNDNRNIFFK